MAKRKRASLKDKSSESLGLTKKKGKGLDLLFGGPADKQEAGAASQPGPGASGSDLSGLDNSGSVSAAASASGEGLVDELGLPVAMEAPPDDLILASSGEGGILEEANSTVGEEETLSSSFDENDLSGLVEEGTPSDTAGADDLSGLVMEDDLSGLVADDLSGLVADDAAADDLSGLVVDDTAADDMSGLVVDDTAADDMSGLAPAPDAVPAPSPAVDAVPQPLPGALPPPTYQPSTPPQTTAAPISVPSPYPAPAYQPVPAPTFSPVGTTPPPGPVSSIPPPSTATGAPSMAAPRITSVTMEAVDDNVVSTLSAFGEGLTREDFKPKDELPTGDLIIREDESGELDDASKEKVLRYIGDRRDKLFEEIQVLHGRVAEELSGNKTDVSFALDTLREANECIIQRPYEYDEALYRVAMVNTMLHHKRHLSKSSYKLGMAILFYGIIFTVLCIAGYFLNIDFATALGDDKELGVVFKAVWFSGLAGGLGGCVEIFWRLYYRVSIKQDFDPQYTMYYLVKPILGFVLGLVMYFLVAIGSSFGGNNTTLPAAGTTTGFALSILLGFIAGYRQESVFDMIYVLVNKIAPDSKKGGGAKSVVPVDEETEKKIEAAASS